jgi:hypothetical protein
LTRIDRTHAVRYVVPRSLQIGETKIDELNVIFFTKTEKLVDTVYEFTHETLLKKSKSSISKSTQNWGKKSD